MTKLNDPVAEAREKELEALFANVPLESDVMVDLPSKGRFYPNFVGVKVSPLLFEDEQRILTSKNKGVNPVNEILSKCVAGVNVNDLLEMDKLALLLKIREISYGKDYKFSVICSECGLNSETCIDSSQIPVNYLPDETTDPREVNLPSIKAKAVVKSPRVRDEYMFTTIDLALKNLYKFVVSINGNEDPVFISKVIARLPLIDSKLLVNAIKLPGYGIDARFTFECPSCKHNEMLGVPFDANFFSVS